MRVLIVGEDQVWSIERSYARAFAAYGVEARVFDWWSAGAPAGRRNLARRPAWKWVAARANPRVIAAAPEWDVVFVVKGLLLDRDTVEALRRRGHVVVCFNPDNPWNPAVTSYSRTAELAMPAYDAYLTWSSYLVSRLYAAGCQRVDVLRFAWDPEQHPYIPLAAGNETTDIVLAANHSDHRERWIRRIPDLPVKMYGAAWADALVNLGSTNLRVAPRVPVGSAYAEEVAHARIALNLVDPFNCPGTNMRSYEVPGVGGVLLSTWTDDVAAAFPEGAVATFRTEQELRHEVRDLLHDASRRDEMRRVSHAVASANTFDHRAAQLMELFSELA